MITRPQYETWFEICTRETHISICAGELIWYEKHIDNYLRIWIREYFWIINFIHLKVMVLYVVTPCSLMGGYRWFWGIFCLCTQSWRTHVEGWGLLYRSVMTRVTIRRGKEEPSTSQWEEMDKISCYKDTLVHCYRWAQNATRWHNPEEHIFINQKCANLKERNVFLLLTRVS
jgi:hypothetical protein